MRRIAAIAGLVAVAVLATSCTRRTPVKQFAEVPTLLTVADLIYDPNAYNRQEVTVEGWYRTGQYTAVLQPGFSYRGGTAIWVYDENHEDEPTGPPQREKTRHRRVELTKQDRVNQNVLDEQWGKTVHVVFQGEFRCGTGFGHQSKYQCAIFLDRVLAVGD